MTTKTLAGAFALALIVAATAATGAEARTRHQVESGSPIPDRHSGQPWAVASIQTQQHRRPSATKLHRHRKYIPKPTGYPERRIAASSQIVAHPPGCPARAFCGCGASIEVFGRSIRELWLAANWLKFPPAAPAPGMVAVRRHHVFVIREVRGPGLVLAYDPNSGGHKTRIHLRSLAGYSVRNPRAGRSRYAEAGG